MKEIYEHCDDRNSLIYLEVETNVKEISCAIDFDSSPYPICYFMKDKRILEPDEVVRLFEEKDPPRYIHSFTKHLYTIFFGHNWKRTLTIAKPSIVEDI